MARNSSRESCPAEDVPSACKRSNYAELNGKTLEATVRQPETPEDDPEFLFRMGVLHIWVPPD